MIGLPQGFLAFIADRLNDPSVGDLWKDPGEKLTKSQMTAIQSLHEKFAGSLAEFLSEWSKIPVKASLISLEQFPFEEFLRSVQRPGFMAGFKSDSLNGKALLAIDLEVIFSLLDRHQGGGGDLPKPLRPLSEPETHLMEKAMGHIIGILRDSWMPVIDLDPTLEFFESNPQFAQIVPPHFKGLDIVFEIRIQSIYGTLRLFLPLATLKRVAGKFHVRNPGKRKTDP